MMAGKALFRALVLFSLLFSQLSLTAAQEQVTWYVAVTGSGQEGTGTLQAPFGTIQYAIDQAQNGDVVVVLEGRYTGPENRNLDFQGKAITVMSQNPEDASIVQATVLDAEGAGVIARFIHDEGPGTVFAGFTLVAGDNSKPVRGVPGYFELSPNARPQTHHLRIVGEGLEPGTGPASLLANGTVAPIHLWDGLDPYHQPNATTNYYGSGDVDNDGNLTTQDASLAREMADGTRAAVHRADVDGSGSIDLVDALMIEEALAGKHLPGWWNSLDDRAERNAWIDRVLALDPTDQHVYVSGWFVCGGFAAQMYIYGAGYRDELNHTLYDGGQARYNLPLYLVTVYSSTFGHAINAILVGENPLNFDDWRFIEPQTDQEVRPGMWDMPYGTWVRMSISNELGWGSSSSYSMVTFSVDATGWKLQEVDPGLQTGRTPPPVAVSDNRTDLWNPAIIPVEEGLLLFEGPRDRLQTPIIDVFVDGFEVPFSNSMDGKPLNLSDQVSRLLDVARGPDGIIHLLWKSKPGYLPGTFYGTLDPTTREFDNVMRISGETHIRAGRLVITPGGEVHAFWLNDYPDRVYWSRLLNTGWQEKQIVILYDILTLTNPGGIHRDISRYLFDVTVLANGDLLLAWRILDGLARETYVYYRQFDGIWREINLLDNSHTKGLALGSSGDGKTHLVSWLYDMEPSDERGILSLRSFDGLSWSNQQTIDDSGRACCASLSSGPGGRLVLIWEREETEGSIPYWSEYSNGGWSVPQAVATRPGSDAWYPVGEFLSNGDLALAWSSRTADLVTIETARVASTMQVSIDVWPGRKPNLVNLNSKASIPVAIRSTPDFNAPALVDWSSLTFGRTGDESSQHWLKNMISPACVVKDIDRDGQADLVCDFEIPKMGFQCGDTAGVLRGRTTEGWLIEGSDNIVTLPCH